MRSPAWFHRDIFAGDTGTDVIAVQRLVSGAITGVMDEDTVARVRGVQRAARSAITGVVDVETAWRLGEKATHGLVPEWFLREDPTVLPGLLRCRESDVENALRRFQSYHHIYPTGEVDEATAIALGD